MVNVTDLMKRYGILTSAGIRKFVIKHLDEINADGIEHARQTPEGWIFDAEAVRIIDGLRGFNQVTIIEQEESELVNELKAEIEQLKNLLLIAQSDLIQTQKLLQDNQTKLLTAENSSKDLMTDLKLEQTLHKVTKQKLNESEEKFSEQITRLENQLEKVKNRGLLARIFNNF